MDISTGDNYVVSRSPCCSVSLCLRVPSTPSSSSLPDLQSSSNLSPSSPHFIVLTQTLVLHLSRLSSSSLYLSLLYLLHLLPIYCSCNLTPPISLNSPPPLQAFIILPFHPPSSFLSTSRTSNKLPFPAFSLPYNLLPPVSLHVTLKSSFLL